MFHFQVSETDIRWPKNICDVCIKNITEWDKLFNKCKEIEKVFKKILSKQEFDVNNTVSVGKNTFVYTNNSDGFIVDNSNENGCTEVKNEKNIITNFSLRDHDYVSLFIYCFVFIFFVFAGRCGQMVVPHPFIQRF